MLPSNENANQHDAQAAMDSQVQSNNAHSRDDDLHAHYAASSAPSSTSYSFSGADLAAPREKFSPILAASSPSSTTSSSHVEPNSAESSFDCNICLEVPTDPIITQCGHLYCWKCVYTWMENGKSECPICKAFISPEKVIPLYGKGRNNGTHAYHRRNAQNSSTYPPHPPNHNSDSSSTPPRPHASRTEAPQSDSSWSSAFQSFFDSSNWSASSPFGGSVGLGGGAGSLTFGAGLGFFPSLFGLSFTYNPQQNNSHRNGQHQSRVHTQQRQHTHRSPAANSGHTNSADEMTDAAFSRLIMFLGLLLLFSVLLY